MKKNNCRFCDTKLSYSFVDLGMSPLSNSYITQEKLSEKENFYPLHAYVCDTCFLVQLDEFESPENIFSDYAYFSSYSKSWLEHAQNYTSDMITRFGFDESSMVVEIASNDGYLLQYFKNRGVGVLGIEPAENVAKVAEEAGIPTLIKFFGADTAKELVASRHQADLLLGNNVLAHVPDINDFVQGMKILLKPGGVITMEFPHLLQLIRENQFDTIYHEHFSYLSLVTVERIFSTHGLTIFDVQELATHGGSLRIFACHNNDSEKPVMGSVTELRTRELSAGLEDIETYRQFSENVKEIKREILTFLISIKRAGKTIVGYGAPAKGNTLLNYCAIREDFVDYTVDRSPHKQEKYLPGTHIPIYGPEKIQETRPDYVFILPWNLKHEIIEQMAYIRDWGGKFITVIPGVEVIE